MPHVIARLGNDVSTDVIYPGRYMATVLLTDPAVQASADWQKAIDTPWSARVRPTYQRRWRVVYRPY